MLPHSDEKTKESLLKKRSFSFINKRHERSQSSSVTTQQPMASTFNLENKRGWLESTPVQVSPSRSLDNRRSYNLTKSSTTNDDRRRPNKDIGKVAIFFLLVLKQL